MQDFDKIDSLTLGAFVDSELDSEHNATIIKVMHENAGVRERVNELRRAKDLMKLGFGTVIAPSGNRNKHSKE